MHVYYILYMHVYACSMASLPVLLVAPSQQSEHFSVIWSLRHLLSALYI